MNPKNSAQDSDEAPNGDLVKSPDSASTAKPGVGPTRMSKESIVPGALYVVSTPIGNLEDISFRAMHILAGVDVIAAEDTRTTGILLKYLGITKPLVSFYSRNEKRRSSELLKRLQQGSSVAVVSDAGTPGISDPAFALIQAATEEDLPVIPVPGASAVLAAIVGSGLPTDRFVFEGFLPVKKGRQSRWKRLVEEERTIVLYESPHRMERTLEELIANLGDRHIAVARELTKKFEQFLRGKASTVLARLRAQAPRGEFVLVIAGKGLRRPDSESPST